MNHYSEIAEFYDRITGRYFDYSKSASQLKDLIKGKDVLDVGTGTANLAILLADESFNVTGIDCSKPMLDIARRKAESRVRIVEGDIRNFSLEDRFDTALFYESALVLIRQGNDYVFETYFGNDEEVREALGSVKRHLNPDGRLIVSVKDERDESVCLDIGDGLTYSVDVERPAEDRLRITHFVKSGNEVVAQSEVLKYRFPFERFQSMVKDTGFATIGFDQSRDFYIADN